MSFRGNMFPSIFRDDPLGDPFEQMDNMMNSMFNDPFFSGGFVQPGFVREPQPNQSHFDASHGQGPVIEEVGDEAEEEADFRSEPIVEEPGDDRYYQNQDYSQRQRQHHQQARNQRRTSAHSNPSGMRMVLGPDGFPNTTTFGNGVGTTSFSYSSSYCSSFGPDQMYMSSTSTRIGPGGVRETQRTVQNGGAEEILISRGIGHRERTVTRRRLASGQEECIDTLQNISSEQGGEFDREWMQQAQVHLPTVGGGFGTHVHPAVQRGGRPQIEYPGSRGRRM